MPFSEGEKRNTKRSSSRQHNPVSGQRERVSAERAEYKVHQGNHDCHSLEHKPPDKPNLCFWRQKYSPYFLVA